MNRCTAFFLLLVLAAAGMAGCGAGGDKLDMTPPEITAMTPISDASDVALNTVVTFTFDKDVSGVSQSSVLLNAINAPSVPVNTDITYDAATRTVTIRPKNHLAVDTYYVVAVTSEIRSATGVSMDATSWVFTTGQATDTLSPTLTAVNPAGDSSFIDVGTKISVTFSEAVISSTITADSGATAGTFRLRNLGTSSYVSGAVSYNEGSHVATFTPSADLDDWTNYQVELTGGIKDLAGNALSGTSFPLVFSFMTNDENSPVVKNKAPTGTGIARSAQVSVTFSELVSQSTVLSSSNFFMQNDSTGQAVYGMLAYDASTKTAILTPGAVLDASTKYNVYLTNGITDLAGNALASMNWSFTTGSDVADSVAPYVLGTMTPQPDAAGVDPDTTISVTFSEAVVGVGASTFTLKKTGSAAAVDAKIVYSESTHVATLAPKDSLDQNAVYTVELTTSIKDNSGNSLIYRSWSFTTADNTKPTVIAKIPGLEGNVATGSTVYVKFSESVQPLTVTDNASFLVQDVTGVIAQNVTGSIVYSASDHSAVFTPSSPFAYSSTYKVTISGIKDIAGNSIVTTSWTFTTLNAPDETAPTIASRDPSGDNPVSIDSSIKFTFSESVVAGCITSSTVRVHLGGDISGEVIPGSLSYNTGLLQVTFLPDTKLLYSQTYTVEVRGSVAGSNIADLSGNTLSDTSWSFTTAADNVNPTVVYKTPENGTTGIAGNGVQVDVGFSEYVTGVTASSFYLQRIKDADGNAVTGGYIPDMTLSDQSNASTHTYQYRIKLTDPAGNPVPDTATGEYAIVLTSAIKDSANNPVSFTANSWTIKISGKDVTAPTVTMRDPDPASAQVWRRNAGVYSTRVSFSETVNGIDNLSFKLERKTGASTYETVTCEAPYYDAGTRTATLSIPDSYVKTFKGLYDTTFRITLSSNITDTANNPLTELSWTITTDADTDPPTILMDSVYPKPDDVDIPYLVSGKGPVIRIPFSEKIAAASVNASTVYLVRRVDGAVASASLAVDDNVITLTPNSQLSGSTALSLQHYDVYVTTGVTDAATTPNALASQKMWSFATRIEPDTTPPYITAVSPSNGDSGQSQNQVCSITFNEYMLNVSSSYLWLEDASGNTVSASVDQSPTDPLTYTVTPSVLLAGGATYYLVCDKTIANVSGLALNTATNASLFTLNGSGNPRVGFTVKADQTGPTCTVKYADSASVTSGDADGWTAWTSGNAVSVRNPRFAITFTEPVYNATSTNIRLALNSTDITAACTYVTYDSTVNTAYIQLRSDGTNVIDGILQSTGTGNVYKITVSASITDTVTPTPNGLRKNETGAGEAAQNYTINFTVPSALPQVSGVSFGGTAYTSSATAVSCAPSNISITFDSKMNTQKAWLELYYANTVDGHRIPVTLGQAIWSNSDRTVTYPLVGKFISGTTYYMKLYGWGGTFEDTHGNPLQRTTSPYLSSGILTFTANKTAGDTAPVLVSSIPSGGKSASASIPMAVLKFNVPMNTSAGTVSITGPGSPALASPVWMDSGKTVVYTASGLAAGSYVLSYSNFADLNGNTLSGTVAFDATASSPVSAFSMSFDTGVEAETGNFIDTDLRDFTSSIYTNLTTDSTYLDGSSAVGCNWYAVKKGFFLSDTDTQLGPVDAPYLAIAANSMWDYGDYADLTPSGTVDRSAGYPVLSFSMAHCSEYNQCDRIVIGTIAGGVFTPIGTVYRHDYNVTKAAPVWKTHYIDISGLDSAARLCFRAYTAGDAGTNVYVDKIGITRY